MDAQRLVADLRGEPRYRDQIVHEEQFPARPARFAAVDPPLPGVLDEALRRLGIEHLYAHQAEALAAARAGASAVVTTGTASGKTLCYALPVFETLLSDPRARALFVYPTKALAQDQADALAELNLGVPAGVYDGDTPAEERRRLRAEARILLTNPDMLHIGILPQHFRWTPFLRSLRYVVLDDMHVYRGIFGSHVALVLRRLRRACRLRGADPQFLCTSATIANPGEFGALLVGTPLRVIAGDGAPRGPRRFLLWNPPAAPRARSGRGSPYLEAARLLAALTRRGVRTIVFTKARKIAELVYRYAAEALRDAPDLASRISPYRAGYLAEERREIERRLFRGELAAVVATSALELGIDVGGLDAAVLVGYPGTMASVWQRAGRAGRGTGESLAVLIALEDALDQYLMRKPAYFFGRPVEHATLDPGNPHVLAAHLRCAAREAALWSGDEALFGPRMRDCAAALEAEGALVRRGGRWHASGRTYPAGGVDIRAAGGRPYRIVNAETRRLLGTVDEARAFEQAHEGAVYLHQGETYRIARLDPRTRTALAEPEDGGYYTEARVLTDVEIERPLDARPVGTEDGGATTMTGGAAAAAYLGEVRVTQQVVEYRRKQFGTDTVLDVRPLALPEQDLRTSALWIVLPDDLRRAAGARGLDFAGGIHAVEHAAIGLLPLLAMCDRWDIGGVSYPHHPETGRATIFIYDGHAGGVGIAEQGFRLLDDLLARTLEAIASCPCEAGCPSCIQSPKCGNLNEPLDKRAAVLVLEEILRARARAGHGP